MRSTVKKSSGIPSSILEKTSSMLESASSTASLCRTFVIIVCSLILRFPPKNISRITSARVWIPSFFFAEITTHGASHLLRTSCSVIHAGRSDLFRRTIAFLPLINEKISSSLSSNAAEESKTARIRSAFSARLLARSTPIFSIRSPVCLIPAVSASRRERPPRRIFSSRESLVVPAISVTIARSSPVRALRSDDFPAFGFPRMTV